jgi:hypothetical protein
MGYEAVFRVLTDFSTGFSTGEFWVPRFQSVACLLVIGQLARIRDHAEQE